MKHNKRDMPASNIRKSGEDYLEAILLLTQKRGSVRSVELAEFLNYSKPSVSRAVAILRDGGFLEVAPDGRLLLTASGKETAVKIYEKHQFFRNKLLEAGVEPRAAEEEGCRMEHAISDDSFRKLKEYAEKQKKAASGGAGRK